VLGNDDRIAPLDSLTLVEFVVALEEKTGVNLLGTPFRPEAFASVTSVLDLLGRSGPG
jgi:acyl carrier protein